MTLRSTLPPLAVGAAALVAQLSIGTDGPRSLDGAFRPSSAETPGGAPDAPATPKNDSERAAAPPSPEQSVAVVPSPSADPPPQPESRTSHRRSVLDPAASVPALERAAAGDPCDRAHDAMVRLMRLEKSRRFVPELVKRARENTAGNPYAMLQQFDRGCALMLGAFLYRKGEFDERKKKLPGLEAAIALIERDAPQLGAFVATAVITANPTDGYSWMTILGSIGAMPREFAEEFASRLQGGTPEERARCRRILSDSFIHFDDGIDVVREAVLTELTRTDERWEVAALTAGLSKVLRATDPASEQLLESVRQGGRSRDTALWAIARLSGRESPEFETRMLALAAESEPSTRGKVVSTLLAFGGPRTIAYATQRLGEAPEAERFSILIGLRMWKDIDEALPLLTQAFREGTDGEARVAVSSALVLDTGLRKDGVVSLLASALADSRPVVRQTAAQWLTQLQLVREPLTTAFLNAFDSKDAEVRLRAIAAMSRLGHLKPWTDRERFVGVLHRLAESGLGLGAKRGVWQRAPSTDACAMLGYWAHHLETARASVRGLLRASESAVRKTALAGLGGLKEPTSEDYQAVAAVADGTDDALRAEAARILDDERWKTLP